MMHWSSGGVLGDAREATGIQLSDYLRHLLANNSHGDASLAVLDERYSLIGALVRDHEGFRTSDLAEFQRPVRPERFTTEHVLAVGRGTRFVRPARNYLFRRDS